MAVTTTSISVADKNGTAQSFATLTDPASIQRSVISIDTPGVAAYRASANFTPTATSAVTMISAQGSATKTVRVKKVGISGVSTALSASVFQLQRTSALGAGGTTVTPTVAKLDSGTVAAATAVVSHYTTTLKAAGTGVGGPISMWQQFTSTVTTPTVAMLPTQPVFPEASSPAGSAIVLRGTADFLEVQNVTPANLGAGTVLAYFVEWEEDAS
jgi:hypothetical protein